MYAITPALVNTVTILVVVIAFNAVFSWRSYPASLANKTSNKVEIDSYPPPIQHEDYVYALSQIDSIVNISEDDLLRIYSLATIHSNKKKIVQERDDILR